MSRQEINDTHIPSYLGNASLHVLMARSDWQRPSAGADLKWYRRQSGEPRMKSISVALATYNGHAFIMQQLESIAGQAHPPAELVVTDDNSADGTVECVERFARTAPFPVQIHRNNKRLGYRANFMRAMSFCRSELVALCDQDDVWDPGKLKVAAAAFDVTDTVLFFHNAWLIDSAGVRIGPADKIGPADIFCLSPYRPPLSVNSLRCPAGFSMVIQRTLLQFSDLWSRSLDIEEQDRRMAHDEWLFFLATVFGGIAYSDLKLTGYRQHSGNSYGYSTRESSVFQAAALAYEPCKSVGYGSARQPRGSLDSQRVPGAAERAVA